MNSKLPCEDIDPSSEHDLVFRDFDAVHTAVLETDRGRWFLNEFSRRQRTVESAEILTALDRLTRRVVAYEFFLGQFSKSRDAPIDFPPEAIASKAPEIPGESEPRPDLGERFAALREIDALDVEAKVKLFA